MPERAGSLGGQSATGPKFGGGALRGGVEGGALPRTGRRAACRVCGKESGASQIRAEEARGRGSQAGDAPAEPSGWSVAVDQPTGPIGPGAEGDVSCGDAEERGAAA